MKKGTLFLLSAFVLLFTSSSCTTYRSINNANTISQLAGNKFMKNISKSIIHEIKKLSPLDVGRIKLNTPLSSVLPSNLMGEFSTILSNRFNIPLNLLSENIGSTNSVRDVISFVAQKGKGFNFYRQ